MTNDGTLSVRETARLLGLNEETIRRQIREKRFEVVPREPGAPSRAPHRIPAAYVEHRLRVQQHERRMAEQRARGFVSGYGPDFLQSVEDNEILEPATKQAIREAVDRQNVADQLQIPADIAADLAALDDEQEDARAIEEAAQRLARRIRREREVARRAQEILEEDDE